MIAQDDVVQPLSHPVQALEFEGRIARQFQDGRDAVRVVRGELRIDAVGHAQQPLRQRDIADIRRGLGGEQRKIRMPLDLGALHLGVPIGTLDQAQHDAAVVPDRQRVQRIDHRPRPLAIGLHDHAEPVPSGQIGVRQDGLDHLQRQGQAVLLLGVDVQAHVRRTRPAGQIADHGDQFGHHPILLRDLIAGVQRRQLDRDAGVPGDGTMRASAGDGRDGLAVFVGIAVGVAGGHRRLAQHVIAVGVSLGLLTLRPLQRGVDGLAQDELASHLAHRAGDGGADHRLSKAAYRAAQDAGQTGLAVVEHPPRQHQRPGRSVDQAGRAVAQVAAPIGGGDLVLDQRVDGGTVGHAQHRLGQAHQGHALAGGQAVFGQHQLHHRGLGLGADAADQVGRAVADPRTGIRRQRRIADQPVQQGRFGLELGGKGKVGHGGTPV